MRSPILKRDLRWWRWQIRELRWQGLSLHEIGRRIGRDHSTVQHHLRADKGSSVAPHLVARGAGL